MIITSPQKNINNKEIDELIGKGGSVAPKKIADNVKIRQIVLRLPDHLIDAIDNAIKGKYGGKTQSRNSFIMQSIEKALNA